jgi:catechol 2,3-dioxygenase-like lactoylglutathione lyase family enzyme
MPQANSSRDIIIRTEAFEEAIRFYEQTLGFPVSSRSERLVGFETGSFCLYVEKGAAQGPVVEYLVADVPSTRDSLLRRDVP